MIIVLTHDHIGETRLVDSRPTYRLDLRLLLADEASGRMQSTQRLEAAARQLGPIDEKAH